MYKEVTHELQPRSFDLLVLPEDVVCSILKALPPEQLLSVSRVRLCRYMISFMLWSDLALRQSCYFGLSIHLAVHASS